MEKIYSKTKLLGTMLLLMLIAFAPGKALADKTIYYLDDNGAVQSCTATAIEGKDAGSDTYTLSEGYYYVSGDITVSTQMQVSGSVHLILLDGCSLNAKGCIVVENTNTLTITAGNTSGSITGSGSLKVTDDYNVTSDGTPKDSRGNDGDNARIGSREGNACGSIIINGGTVLAYSTFGGNGSIYGADLGSGYKGSGGTITINDGTVHAWGGYSDVNSMSAAAIGSGYKTSGGGITININGGNIDAYCTGGKYKSYAAGIGTGENAESPATINIKGGKVYAYSSSAYLAYGAGIGTGQTYESTYNTEINISGGTVTAYSSHNGEDEEGYGAGIGMGEEWSDKYGKVNITITGGTVTGISGNYCGYGSGIGGGKDGGCGEIKISGSANVKAYNCSTSNDPEASGIGDGEGPVGGSLTITGDHCVVDTWGNCGIGDSKSKFTTTISPQYGSFTMNGGSSYDTPTSAEVSDESKTLSETTDKWVNVTFEPKTITVTYDANGGTGEMESSTGDAGDHEISKNLYTREYYVFTSWNTSKDGTGTSYNPGDTIQSSEDVILYAQWKPSYACYYMAENGTTKNPNDCYVLTADRAQSTTELESGLWVVKDSIASTVRLYVNTNDVTLILLDGAQLDASAGGIEVNAGGKLAITVGNTTEDIAGTGSLIAQGGGYPAAGIGGGYKSSGGTVNIIGGTVTAIGGSSASGIGGGSEGSGGIVNIYGGTVTATGGGNASGIGGGYESAGGTVNISGGTVMATGGNNGSAIGGGNKGSGGTVNISGGTVMATGGNNGSAIGGGYKGSGGKLIISGKADVTVKSTSDDINALSCDTATAKTNVHDLSEGYRVCVKKEDGTNFTGTPSDSVNLVGFSDLDGDNYQYAHIFLGKGYTVTFNANDENGTTKEVRANVGENISTINEFKNNEKFFIEWNTKADGSGVAYRPSANTYFVSDITLYAQWDESGYYYTDSNGNVQEIPEKHVNILENASNYLTSGLWVVKDTVVSTGRIYVNTNNVTLILLDDAKLDASAGGISVKGDGNLTITIGNTTKKIAGTGSLIASGGVFQAGIGSPGVTESADQASYICGTVNIIGGTVTAIGGDLASGIGGGCESSGGTVNISGGTVMATGGNHRGSAIGGGYKGSKGKLIISGKADVTVKSTIDYDYATPALNCDTATATPSEGYSVYVQDEDGNDFIGTPTMSEVNLLGFSGTDKDTCDYQYAHILIAETKPIEVTIGTTGWASLYYGNYNLEIPSGVMAYIVTDADTTKHTLNKTRVASIIPAGTAVILCDRDTTKANTYSFNVTSETNSANLSANILRGYDKPAVTTAYDDGTDEYYYFYKLSRNAAGDNNSVGFYWDVDGGGVFTIPAHKAYMFLEKAWSNSAKYFLFNDSEDTTGIENPPTAIIGNGKIYDISGRYFGTDVTRLPKGLYIMNGKKFVVE